MKLGIVRGSNLNPYEMQSYEPLASSYDIVGYAAYRNQFELDSIRFPVRRFHMPEEYSSRLFWPLGSIAYGAMLPRGWNFRMFGLEKALGDRDILHAAETFNGYSYQCARVKKQSGKKLVLTIWENVPFLSVRSFKGFGSNERIVDFVRANTDRFIAVTGRAKMALMVEGVPEERIRVVPAGVDVSRFSPAAPDPGIQERLGVQAGDFTLLFVGRLERQKGIYDLVYAFRLLALDRSMAHVKVALAGTGPDAERLRGLIKKLGLEGRVRLVGGFSYAEVPGVYNSADALILPSIPTPVWQEQFGMVLVEAMASGLPVIASMSGSIPEVVGDCAVTVQPNDPLSIYEAVKRLASDEAGRRKLGRACRQRALELFDARAVSRRIDSVYRELG